MARRRGPKQRNRLKQGSRKKSGNSSPSRRVERIPTLPQTLETRVWTHLQSAKKRPVGVRELASALSLTIQETRKVRRFLKGQARAGRVQQFRGSRFVMKEFFDPKETAGDYASGVLRVGENGHGSVELEGGERLFVPSKYLAGALHQDTVAVVRLPERRGQTAGRVVAIEEPYQGRIVGIVRKRNQHFILEPESERYPLFPISKMADAREGEEVVARLMRDEKNPAIVVVDVEGKLEGKNGPERDRERSMVLMELEKFPQDAWDEAQRVAVAPTKKDLEGRLDLRDVPLVTIDGKDARDFDDAVACVPLEDGETWRVIVAVADVSHYVEWNSPLDREAQRRATSVYFPSYCVPMLPEALSNEICSLKPHVERLCMAVTFEVKNCLVQRAWIDHAVMKSKERLTYDQVAEVLDACAFSAEGSARDLPRAAEGLSASAPSKEAYLQRLEAEGSLEKEALEEAKANPAWNVRDMLLRLAIFSRSLREERSARGAIDFEIPEPVVVFDDEGEIATVKRSSRHFAHKLIEELMLLANEAVADHFIENALPGIFRVHGQPNGEKVETFIQALKLMGVRLPEAYAEISDDVDWDLAPRFFNELLGQLEGHHALPMMNQMLLRSMMQANYSSENIGHFGLALHRYLHFTSPIRRYPDLWVHRILTMIASGDSFRGEAKDEMETLLEEAAEHSSQQERRAMEAERDVLSRYRARLIERHIGEEFDGRICSVTSFGFFVELDEPFVEGLVHIRTLDGFYEYDEERFCLFDAKAGEAYRLGDRVRIEVLNASPSRGEIDFALLEHTSSFGVSPSE